MIDTSGVALHKRGYRPIAGPAPLRETLAAALAMTSRPKDDVLLWDPFCGSGTIAIEAARIALNIAGGVNRRFAFNNWTNFDQKYYDLAFTEAKDKEERNRKVEIFASDIDTKAIKLAKRHAERLRLRQRPHQRFACKELPHHGQHTAGVF